MRRVAHRATTAHVQALYPWMAEPGLGSRGVPVGLDIFGHRTFCFDPFEQYQKAGGLTNLNVSVSGMIGKRKSALLKTWAFRWSAGALRQLVVMDVKPEYYGLAALLGVPTIRIGADSSVCMNPLDPRVSGERQVELLEAILASRLRRALIEEERVAIEFGHGAARAIADDRRRQPELSDVLAAMLSPDPAAAARVGFASVESFVAATRTATLALRGICQGRLKATLDGQTSADLDLTAKMLHFDLSSEKDTGDIGVLMCCAAAFLQGAVAVGDGIKRVMVLDEAWRLLEDARTARWLRASNKLSRQGAGLSHWYVMHRFADYEGAGDAGTEQHAHAKGLLADTETRVVYAQSPADAAVVKETLGLTNCQAKALTTAPPGTALWCVGGRRFLVAHRLASEVEAALVHNGLDVAV